MMVLIPLFSPPWIPNTLLNYSSQHAVIGLSSFDIHDLPDNLI